MERHKKIRELNLEETILNEFFSNNKSISVISQELGVPFSAVQRFIREHKLKNFSDNKLEAVARSGDNDALVFVNDLFDTANYARKEMAMTAILAQLLREEIAEILAEKGVTGLLEAENAHLLNLWFKNSEKLSKLQANVPKYLDSYVNLFTQVLDLQRQVSFVKVVTEELRKADPALHNKIYGALNKDTAAKALMGSITSQEIVEYWASERTAPGRYYLSKQIEEDSE